MKGQVLLILDGRIEYKGIHSHDELMQNINEILAEGKYTYEELYNRLKVYRVVNGGYLAQLEPELKKPDVSLYDGSVSDDEQFEYEIVDGYYNGTKFTDIDDVHEWIQEKYKDGELSFKDIKNLEFVRTATVSMSFDDAELDAEEIRLPLYHGTQALELHTALFADYKQVTEELEHQLEMGAQFMETEKEKEAPKTMKPWHPASMSDEELDERIKQYEDRLGDLYMERSKRRLSK